MKEKSPLVSICCITYNQCRFISQTIEGFLKQKCNFKFEIIIHDDCSTDGTINILKCYEKSYNDIIKIIHESENQFSRGKKIFPLTFSEAKGKYIAVCEGDDYWLDENKLQKQVNYMEMNTNCTLTFHDALILDSNTNKIRNFFPYEITKSKYYKFNGIYDAGEIDLLGFIPTASFVFKRETIINLPVFYFEAPVEDLTIKLLSTAKGYAHYFDDKMSVYRINTGCSVMDSWGDYSQEKRVNIDYALIDLIKSFDNYTKFRYHEKLKISVDLRIININFRLSNGHILRQKHFKKLINKMNWQEKKKLYLIMYFSKLMKFLKKTKLIIGNNKYE